MPRLADRLRGGVLGLLIGDALGVPYEFHRAADIPAWAHIEMEPPPGFPRSHSGTPPGTWSDDGAQALCLLASLLDRGRLDIDDLGRRLLRWYHEGYLAADGRVFDVGVTTGSALSRLAAGVPAIEAGDSDHYSQGNGSLMRALPLALWHRGTDAELAGDADRQSRVTHGHPSCRVACALYCLWARGLMEDRPSAWSHAVETLRALLPSDGPERHALEWTLRVDDAGPGTGSGFVADSLRSVRALLAHDTYEAVVRAAVALGQDTDTTAAVAGGLAGLRDGVHGIPERWVAGLRSRELAHELVEMLVRYRLA
ncbi:MAG: ADP-ribosylglycohydrolase family protein [Chloroflexota bacterium]